MALAIGALVTAGFTVPKLASLGLDMLACPGPVLEPAPRLDAFGAAFSAKLTQEVAARDAAGVRLAATLEGLLRQWAGVRGSLLSLQGVDVVFYGDSITETWRGSDMGAASARTSGALEHATACLPGIRSHGCSCLNAATGVPAIFEEYFGSGRGRRAHVLAVGGV